MGNRVSAFGMFCLLSTSFVFAGFAGTDIYLPSVGSAIGNAPWYTTVWLYNPNSSPALVTFHLLKRQANPDPASYSDTIQPGDVKRYDDAVQFMFNESAFGALRIVSDRKVLVSSRIYAKALGGQDRDSRGQYFGGIPASFAIGSGEATQIVGVSQTSSDKNVSDFRFNVGVVETTGNGVAVSLRLVDETGTQAGNTKIWSLGAREQKQDNMVNLFGVAIPNGHIEVSVGGGGGKVIAFGSSVANGSDDPSTVEMHFADSLIAASGGSGTITGVTAGPGLIGGGTSGTVSLAVATPLELSGRTNNPVGIIRGSNSGSGAGVLGFSSSGVGVAGVGSLSGVAGASATGVGVTGQSSAATDQGAGVYGYWGTNSNTFGLVGFNNGGVYADYNNKYVYLASKNYAIEATGNVIVNGWIYKSGGSFRIDHPLDPYNKFLSHSFVESPEMKNVYDGLVMLGGDGRATVTLPEWFEALNQDFRYQLTAVGTPAPGLFVAEEVAGNRFTIAGGTPGLKVSWQVTGVRHDAYARSHPMQVEQEKVGTDIGTLVSPEAGIAAGGAASANSPAPRLPRRERPVLPALPASQ